MHTSKTFPTSQQTHYFSITKTNRLVLFKHCWLFVVTVIRN